MLVCWDAERDAFVAPLVSAALAAGCGLIYVCDGRSPKRVAAGLAAGRPDRVRRSAVGP